MDTPIDFRLDLSPDPAFLKKLELYKTALYPARNTHVAILGHHIDEQGQCIVHIRIANTDERRQVFHHELERYVL